MNTLEFKEFHLVEISTWKTTNLSLIIEIFSDIFHESISQNWFNLGNLLSEQNILQLNSNSKTLVKLKISLKPTLISEIINLFKQKQEFIQYLSTLENIEKNTVENSIPVLLKEENWYCLSIIQNQPDNSIKVINTPWEYMNLDDLNDPILSNKAIADGITRYVSSTLEKDLSNLTEELSSSFLKDLTQGFTNGLGSLLQEDEDKSLSLLSCLMQFFEEDDWAFSKLQGQPVLALNFAGKNSEWTCFAQAQEEQKRVVFYSICPISAVEIQIMAIAEFLTRANYGLIIGNFELSFGDGEIRYKTSIDVEGSTLNSALIKNMVYANVLTMDQYLPGIEAVVQQGMNAEAAITLVES